jgi:mRNA interferase MazF
MTKCEPGTIVLVRFPFTDLSSTKKRPAIIISPQAYAQRMGDVVVMALTSQNQNDPTLLITQWQAARLPKPTWIKPVIGTLSVALIERELGKLDPRDRPCVRVALGLAVAMDWH